jgi:hypothetical protein
MMRNIIHFLEKAQIADIEVAVAGTSVPDLLTTPEPECFAPWISRFFLPPHSFLKFHSCMFLLSVESTPIQGDATLAWLEYKNWDLMI